MGVGFRDFDPFGPMRDIMAVIRQQEELRRMVEPAFGFEGLIRQYEGEIRERIQSNGR